MNNKICQSCGMPTKYGKKTRITNEKMKEHCTKLFPSLKDGKIIKQIL